MHIYIFGSICRGEIDVFSDIDLLLLTDQSQEEFDSDRYSIYSYERIQDLWSDGSPFAWHLHKESKLVYSEDKTDFLSVLGAPAKYNRIVEDCEKFYEVFLSAKASLEEDESSIIFDFSIIFLCLRNIAICYSLNMETEPIFSRRSALMLRENSIDIPHRVFVVLENARIAATRGVMIDLSKEDVSLVVLSINKIEYWIIKILNLVRFK